MIQSVNAIAINGYINVSWVFRHTGGQEINDIEVLCNATNGGSSGGIYEMHSCGKNNCSMSNLMGSTNIGPVTAGLLYSCSLTATNTNGTDSRTIDKISSIEGKSEQQQLYTAST